MQQQQQLAAAISAAAGNGLGVQAGHKVEATDPYMLEKGPQQQSQAAVHVQQPVATAVEPQLAGSEQQTALLGKELGEAAEALLLKLAAIRGEPLALAAPAAPTAAPAAVATAGGVTGIVNALSGSIKPSTQEFAAAAVEGEEQQQLLEQQLQQLSDAAAALLRQHGSLAADACALEQAAKAVQQQPAEQQQQHEVLPAIQAVQQQAAAVAPVQQQQQQQEEEVTVQEEQLYAADLQKGRLLQQLLAQMIETAGAIQRAAAAGAPVTLDASQGPLQQHQQQQGKAQLEQRLKRLSDAAAALLLGS
jgi:hypothetical protein